MTTDLSSRLFDPVDLSALVERAESNRGDLISRCQQVLRKYLFSNRFEIHPRSLADIAAQEAEALIYYLRNPATTGKDHGISLCEQGMSSQSVFGLGMAYWEFLLVTFGSDPRVMELSNLYFNTLLDGFFGAREKLMLKEQESFRLAFQMALNRSTADIQEARSLAQKATESSYRNIILAQEEERRRISRELHDEAGQALIGIHMSLENLLSDSASEQNAKRERIEKAIVLTDNAMKEIRALAYSLRPPVLDLLGIHLTVKQLCLEFSEQAKLIINYSGMEFPKLADEVAITIYRMVQEALTNIAKHAQAKHVWVKLGYVQDMIELTIRDDGRGFDPEIKTTGIGLVGMQERLRLLNGSLKIESSRGKFSQLNVILPLVLKISEESPSE